MRFFGSKDEIDASLTSIGHKGPTGSRGNPHEVRLHLSATDEAHGLTVVPSFFALEEFKGKGWYLLVLADRDSKGDLIECRKPADLERSVTALYSRRLREGEGVRATKEAEQPKLEAPLQRDSDREGGRLDSEWTRVEKKASSSPTSPSEPGLFEWLDKQGLRRATADREAKRLDEEWARVAKEVQSSLTSLSEPGMFEWLDKQASRVREIAVSIGTANERSRIGQLEQAVARFEAGATVVHDYLRFRRRPALDYAPLCAKVAAVQACLEDVKHQGKSADLQRISLSTRRYEAPRDLPVPEEELPRLSPGNWKYRFTGETIVDEESGKRLYRIARIEAAYHTPLGDRFKLGQKGGYIEKESNLDFESPRPSKLDCDDGRFAWVGGNARVLDNARVMGHALVGGNARVSGNALVVGGIGVISGQVLSVPRLREQTQGYHNVQLRIGEVSMYHHIWILDEARVSEDAVVSGAGLVKDRAEVRGHAWVHGFEMIQGTGVVVSGNARVSGTATVLGGGARVRGNARVTDNATVWGIVDVSGDQEVSGDTAIIAQAPDILD